MRLAARLATQKIGAIQQRFFVSVLGDDTGTGKHGEDVGNRDARRFRLFEDWGSSPQLGEREIDNVAFLFFVHVHIATYKRRKCHKPLLDGDLAGYSQASQLAVCDTWFCRCKFLK